MNVNDHQLRLSYARLTNDQKYALKRWARLINFKLSVCESFWLRIASHKFVMSQGMLF